MAKGGMTKGPSHKEGGIKFRVKDTGQIVELEGGEGVINKAVMSSGMKISLNGKEMTPCEAASTINQMGGNGVKFDCDTFSYEGGGKIALVSEDVFANGGGINYDSTRYQENPDMTLEEIKNSRRQIVPVIFYAEGGLLDIVEISELSRPQLERAVAQIGVTDITGVKTSVLQRSLADFINDGGEITADSLSAPEFNLFDFIDSEDSEEKWNSLSDDRKKELQGLLSDQEQDELDGDGKQDGDRKGKGKRDSDEDGDGDGKKDGDRKGKGKRDGDGEDGDDDGDGKRDGDRKGKKKGDGDDDGDGDGEDGDDDGDGKRDGDRKGKKKGDGDDDGDGDGEDGDDDGDGKRDGERKGKKKRDGDEDGDGDGEDGDDDGDGKRDGERKGKKKRDGDEDGEDGDDGDDEDRDGKDSKSEDGESGEPMSFDELMEKLNNMTPEEAEEFLNELNKQQQEEQQEEEEQETEQQQDSLQQMPAKDSFDIEALYNQWSERNAELERTSQAAIDAVRSGDTESLYNELSNKNLFAKGGKILKDNQGLQFKSNPYGKYYKAQRKSAEQYIQTVQPVVKGSLFRPQVEDSELIPVQFSHPFLLYHALVKEIQSDSNLAANKPIVEARLVNQSLVGVFGSKVRLEGTTGNSPGASKLEYAYDRTRNRTGNAKRKLNVYDSTSTLHDQLHQIPDIFNNKGADFDDIAYKYNLALLYNLGHGLDGSLREETGGGRYSNADNNIGIAPWFYGSYVKRDECNHVSDYFENYKNNLEEWWVEKDLLARANRIAEDDFFKSSERIETTGIWRERSILFNKYVEKYGLIDPADSFLNKGLNAIKIGEWNKMGNSKMTLEPVFWSKKDCLYVDQSNAQKLVDTGMVSDEILSEYAYQEREKLFMGPPALWSDKNPLSYNVVLFSSEIRNFDLNQSSLRGTALELEKLKDQITIGALSKACLIHTRQLQIFFGLSDGYSFNNIKDTYVKSLFVIEKSGRLTYSGTFDFDKRDNDAKRAEYRKALASEDALLIVQKQDYETAFEFKFIHKEDVDSLLTRSLNLFEKTKLYLQDNQDGKQYPFEGFVHQEHNLLIEAALAPIYGMVRKGMMFKSIGYAAIRNFTSQKALLASKKVLEKGAKYTQNSNFTAPLRGMTSCTRSPEDPFSHRGYIDTGSSYGDEIITAIPYGVLNPHIIFPSANDIALRGTLPLNTLTEYDYCTEAGITKYDLNQISSWRSEYLVDLKLDATERNLKEEFDLSMSDEEYNLLRKYMSLESYKGESKEVDFTKEERLLFSQAIRIAEGVLDGTPIRQKYKDEFSFALGGTVQGLDRLPYELTGAQGEKQAAFNAWVLEQGGLWNCTSPYNANSYQLDSTFATAPSVGSPLIKMNKLSIGIDSAGVWILRTPYNSISFNNLHKLKDRDYWDATIVSLKELENGLLTSLVAPNDDNVVVKAPVASPFYKLTKTNMPATQRLVGQWGFSNGILRGYEGRKKQGRANEVLPTNAAWEQYNPVVLSKVNAALHEILDIHICAGSYQSHDKGSGQSRMAIRYYGFFSALPFILDSYPTKKQSDDHLNEEEKLVLGVLYDCLQAYPQLLLDYSIADKGEKGIAAYQPITKKVFQSDEISPYQNINLR